MPRISVIVPIYKVELYLQRCIDSILTQAFSDFELILVDDGSPDNCGAICDEYAKKDSRVRVIHKENGGVSKARNAALDIARGTYIAFCDSDDYWSKEYLQQAMEAFASMPSDMVIMNYCAVDEEKNTILRRTEHITGNVRFDSDEKKYSYLYEYVLKGKHGWEACLRVYRRDIIQKNSIRFCETCGNYAEDLGFTMEYVLCSHSVCSLGMASYYYVMRGNSMMHNSYGIVKLDQINEVSHHVSKRYMDCIAAETIQARFPVLHFWMMFTELNKIIGTDRYCELGKEFSQIKRNAWCKKQLKLLKRCKRDITEYYSERVFQQIMLLAHYCCHGNWKRFCYESAIAYKWLIAKE